MEGLAPLISELGFPIAVAAYFIWRDKQNYDRTLKLHQKTTAVLESAAEALKQNTRALEGMKK